VNVFMWAPPFGLRAGYAGHCVSAAAHIRINVRAGISPSFARAGERSPGAAILPGCVALLDRGGVSVRLVDQARRAFFSR